MRAGTASLLALMAFAALGACMQDASREPEKAPLAVFNPLSRAGHLDVISPNVPFRETSPVCQVFTAGEPLTLHNLTAAIGWAPASARSERLSFEFDAAGTAADARVVGPSPLNLSATTFLLAPEEAFRLRVGLVGEEASDRLANPQEVRFGIAFVVERPAGVPLGVDAIWSTARCPS